MAQDQLVAGLVRESGPITTTGAQEEEVAPTTMDWESENSSSDESDSTNEELAELLKKREPRKRSKDDSDYIRENEVHD